MKCIEMVVSPKGETTVQTKGFIGGSCRDASKLLEQALGQTEVEHMTGEFYQTNTINEPVRQQTGR